MRSGENKKSKEPRNKREILDWERLFQLYALSFLNSMLLLVEITRNAIDPHSPQQSSSRADAVTTVARGHR
ncbi:MAG: hypothetical protein PHQ41_10370, partial [Candidatus Cloacimonetes bacterium]|nr:hypothetical protein [Candidatus Cloacimonadota bacterium]